MGKKPVSIVTLKFCSQYTQVQKVNGRLLNTFRGRICHFFGFILNFFGVFFSGLQVAEVTVEHG
jgi:hypothetical protein